MKLVRGTMLGLVTCLALTGTPVTVATAAAPQSERVAQAPDAKKDWQVLQAWKNGAMRACRGKWDGDSFLISFQLVNRADSGRRGGVLGVRSEKFPEWDNIPISPIAAGTKETFIEADVAERPRKVRVRAKVTKGEKKSRWGDVVRVDRLGLC